MNELLQYYTKRLLALAGGMMAAVLFFNNLTIPFLLNNYGADHLYLRAAKLLISRLSIVFILAAGDVVVRKYFWKIGP